MTHNKHTAGKDIWQEPEAPGDEHPEDRSHEERRRKQRLEGWTWKVPVWGNISHEARAEGSFNWDGHERSSP